MSIIEQHAQFCQIPNDSLFVTATLWRGAMIDRFAQIEFFIDRSLSHCVANSIVSSRDAEVTLPRHRCKALLNALEKPRLLHRFHAASRTLNQAFERWEERNILCHGRMKLEAQCVTFDWAGQSRASLSDEPSRFTAIDMLDKLTSMDRLKTNLGSQLGSVDKFCANLDA